MDLGSVEPGNCAYYAEKYDVPEAVCQRLLDKQF